MRKHLYLIFIAISILACSPSDKSTGKVVSLDEQIGQMLLVGFRGLAIDSSEHIVRDIKQHKIGGIILYEYDVPSKTRPRNIQSSSQVKQLVSDLQKASKQPLFIAIDEEGGRISRFKTTYDFPATRSAQYLGELNREDTTRYWANVIAKQLKTHGVNMNFAPVVDLNTNPESPAIGKLERSYSKNPTTVAKHAGYVIDEHRKQKVLTCIKHFPGHGSALADSHKGFTDVTETWIQEELKPYETLIKAGGCDMVMTAHVFNKKLDDVPATLSSKIMNDILRKRYGWKGVIISDDMQMGAIAQHYGLETALEKSINAGVDVLIFSNNIPGEYDPEIVPKAVKAIKELVYSGKIKDERIRAAYDRITTLKQRL